MNLKTKTFLTGCLILAALVLMAGCAAKQTPYEINDAESYCVSVKYDANGGFFTTNTSVIVDSYNLAEGKAGSDGMTCFALIPPDHQARGNDAFAPVNNGYFLAGWYTDRTETADGYAYSGRWDFEQDLLEVDASGSYTASEPVLTLYAAWLPMFQVEFLDRATGENLGSYSFDPTLDPALKVPQWNMESGAVEMYKFPSRKGYTFEAAYYDAEGKQPVDTDTLAHPGTVDYATGTTADHTMSVYLDWAEGEWYHIYNVDQFLEHASVTGSYVLHADLDFTDKIWPTSLMYGGFTGTIQGNGHTLRNISLTQTNNSKVNAGLFGRLAETAVLEDVAFENVTFTIQAGTRVAGTSYGLLSGAIADSASLTGVQVTSGTIQIDSRCYFGVEDYTIGLLCGMGNADLVDYSGITCVAVGDAPETVAIAVDGNEVTLAFGE